MAFNGIYPAPALSPLKFGLFSVAEVRDEGDERWLRGFSVEYDSNPTVRTVSALGATAHIVADSGVNGARWYDVQPFYIQAEDARSAFSVTGEDRFARVLKQIKAASQKAVEDELENGWAARVDGNGNDYLANGATCQLAATTPQIPADALAMLEDALSASPTGEQGVIHMTRGLAIRLHHDHLVRFGEDHLETVNGTPVVVGAGYKGNSPTVATATASLTSNVVTINTATAHGLSVGDTVTVYTDNSELNGSFTVASAPDGDTFTYALTHVNISSGAVAGSIQRQSDYQVSQWMYGTSTVTVLLGNAELITTSLAQGWDVTGNDNDIIVQALRPAAVHFDPVLHYGIEVDLTA